jgi:hypothetical protein
LDVLEMIKLRLPTPERLEIGEPLLAPALRQIEAFAPALVVVADKECAETFGVILDEVVPIADLIGQEVKHSKAAEPPPLAISGKRTTGPARIWLRLRRKSHG